MATPCPNCREELLVSEVPENRILYCCNCGYESREWWPSKPTIWNARDRAATITMISRERAKKPAPKTEKKVKRVTDRKDYVPRRSCR